MQTVKQRLIKQKQKKSLQSQKASMQSEVAKQKAFNDAEMEVMAAQAKAKSEAEMYRIKKEMEQQLAETDAAIRKIAMETAFLEQKNAIFFKSIGYLKKIDEKDTTKIYKIELDIRGKRDNVMVCKNNNFLSYVCYNHPPYHEYRTERKNRSSVERNKIWKKYYGNKSESNCPIFGCKTMMERDVPYGFHLGHIISLHNKGKDEVSNIRPICCNCNSRMPTENFDDYNNKIKKDYLWKHYKSENVKTMDVQKI